MLLLKFRERWENVCSPVCSPENEMFHSAKCLVISQSTSVCCTSLKFTVRTCKNYLELFICKKLQKLFRKYLQGKFWKEKNDIHFQTPIINNINYF